MDDEEEIIIDNDGDGQWENEEQDYELVPRNLSSSERVVEGLPIKRLDGKIERVMRKKEEKKDKDEDEDKEEEEIKIIEDEELGEQEQFDDDFDEDSSLTLEEKILKLKEEIADLAEKLIEDPEENISSLTRLRRMAESKNPYTSRLSTLALVPVFKTICPSYKIRALTETEKREKVSKDVAKLRNFEQILVLNYKNYINILFENSKNFSNTTGRYCTIAACEIVSSLRHFNFRADVIQILCFRITRKPLDEKEFQVFRKCVTTLESLLLEDVDSGDITYDVVRILSKSLKNRSYKVIESVVNIFLSLSLLSDYDPNNISNDDNGIAKIKQRKKDRVYLSKKERKQRKERKLIDEEMRKAEQAVSEEERERFQAQTLKMVLSTYLEILKNKPEYLMAPVLEGLARFGHMANFDLLGDFLEVLKEVSSDILSQYTLDNIILTPNQIRQVLLCITTSFALIANHASYKVSIDLSKFVDSLYKVLPLVSCLDADIEFSHKSLRLIDPLSHIEGEPFKPAVNVSTEIELLLKSLESIFFKSKSGSKLRAAAFTKRIYMALLHTPEKSSIALLKFVEKLTSKYPEVAGLYSTEDRISNGIFLMEEDEPTRSNPDASTLWETVLLEKHYCPSVAKGAKSLLTKSKLSDK
ncbi:hypothetical protein PACTADRAFT_45992 [Pachysolen tannophilus NRRL Y-2460]|uniref:Nucleolar complex-associated protein 3 n=1 Tax=Pachysolen tannophilus NRRL Y-2460 TaxID=669874 RepID=A0A1E4TPE0_PACTA|nr:hypothetical protein PACTADRAFT_45992 [Pachysolen tannophilus NRRL Y-2460]